MSIEVVQVASISAALAAYVAVTTALLNRLRRKRVERKDELKKKRNEFIEVVKNSLSNGTISDLDDVHNLYLGFFDEENIDQWTHDEVTLYLRKVILEISSAVAPQSEDRNETITFLKYLIRESEARSDKATQGIPFSRAPNPERGLLTDILELAGKENEFVRGKLKELAHTITVRQETISQLSDEKGRSLRWAKWGVFGTVFFSAVSIALTIFK